ncbi:MAG TPA: FAD-binding oxidoreductase, partial [Chitinophaga sp.]
MNYFSTVNHAHLEAFRAIVGAPFVLTDPEHLARYAHDETEDLHYPPAVVLKPDTTEQVSRIMEICTQYHLPVTPRGAGTGLSGGALPQHGGVLLSMERFNRITHIDERNLQVTTE